MKSFAKSALAVVAGLFVSVLLITAIETASHKLYTPTVRVDSTDANTLREMAAGGIPTATLVLVLVAWAVGVVAGGWVAARFAPRSPMAHAHVVAVILLLATVANLLMIPHPLWVWAAALAIFPLGAYAGARMATRARRAV